MSGPADLRSPQVPDGPEALARARPALALDLGGTRTRAALVSAGGGVSHRIERETPRAHGREQMLAASVEMLRQVRREDSNAEPAVIGISCPGPLDPRTGVVQDPPNMGADFRDVAIGERLESALGLPAFVERDTLAAALGEGVFGAAWGARDYLYLTVSTGIGGAVVSDGRLMLGPDGTAGELGHLVIDMDGEPCGCGARGHLEAIASGTGIARSARAAIESGKVTFLASMSTPDGPSAKDVAEAADAGDALSIGLMERARRAFAAACVSFVDVFNPDLIVVGGAIAQAQGDRWLDPARELVAATAFRRPGERVQIVPAALGEDVGLIGAFVVASVRAADDRWRGGRPIPIGTGSP